MLEARNIVLQRRQAASAREIFKRGFDLVVASLGLVLCLPFLALIALLIRLDSPGPVIFRQKRIGRYGDPFFVYKFRTMRHLCGEDETPECDGLIIKGEADPRVTRI